MVIKKSIALCHDVGLDGVSCSAPRVPVARLAAAQAALLRSSYVAYVATGAMNEAQLQTR
jgi:hypothetical protein